MVSQRTGNMPLRAVSVWIFFSSASNTTQSRECVCGYYATAAVIFFIGSTCKLGLISRYLSQFYNLLKTHPGE